MGDAMKFIIILNILQVKKVVLQIVLIIISKEPELIHIVLYLQKTLTFHNIAILIKSVVNKNENEYYYNIFLEKGLYKDKSNTEYF